MQGQWFANRGQILRVVIALIGLCVVIVDKYNSLLQAQVSAMFLVSLMVLLVIVSVWVMVMTPAQHWIDSKTKQLARQEFASLNLAEKLALRMYHQNRRATDQQIRQYLNSFGFSCEGIDIFAALNSKTRFMDRDFVGPNGIKPEFQRLVAKLLKGLKV